MDAATDELETLGLGLYYEDCVVGRRFKTVGRTVTEADITAFVGVTGMTEVLFTNVEYLEHESHIKGRLAPGALVYTFAEGLLIQCTMQHTGLAFLEMDFKVERPVFAGDTIHVEVEVIEAHMTSKGDKGIVRTRNEIKNQRGETVIVYTPKRMVKARG